MKTDAHEGPGPRPRRWGLVVRGAITVLLLVVVAASIDRSEIELRFGVNAGWWMLAGVGWLVAARLLLVLRWQCLLRVLGCRVSSWRLTMMVFASQALGLVAPGSIGMDLARGALLRVDGRGAGATGAAVVSSIVLDRAAATIGTALVGLIAAIALAEWAIAGVILGITIAGIAGAALLVSSDGWARAVLRRILPGRLGAKLLGTAERVLGLLSTPGMASRGLAPAILLGALVTAGRAMLFLSVYHALGAAVPVWLTLLVLSVTLIAMMAPITLGGFGIREIVLAVGFESIGVPAATSVSVGVLAFVVQTLLSVPFALWAVFAVGRGRRGMTRAELESR